MPSYNSYKAFRALLNASLLSLLRTPSHFIFNIVFPLMSIIGTRYISIPTPAGAHLHVITTPSFKDSILFNKLRKNPLLTLSYEKEISSLHDATLTLSDTLHITYFTTNEKQRALLYNAILAANSIQYPLRIHLSPKHNNYQKEIPLLRILAFIIFSSSIFGVAFTFFHLKNNNVFKLISATPISRTSILSAELLSRFIFLSLSTLLVFIISIFILSLPIEHGTMYIKTMLFLMLGAVSFMPYGLLVSILARSITSVPVLGNMIAIPQWALGGLFFSNTHLPLWLQRIANLLPFPHFNSALQEILTNTITSTSFLTHIVILFIWGGIGYFLCYKTFQWHN